MNYKFKRVFSDWFNFLATFQYRYIQMILTNTQNIHRNTVFECIDEMFLTKFGLTGTQNMAEKNRN